MKNDGIWNLHVAELICYPRASETKAGELHVWGQFELHCEYRSAWAIWRDFISKPNQPNTSIRGAGEAFDFSILSSVSSFISAFPINIHLKS